MYNSILVPSSQSTIMQEKSLLHGANAFLGFLVIITPTPPAALTVDEALDIVLRLPTVVKQRTTFPDTGVLLTVTHRLCK